MNAAWRNRLIGAAAAVAAVVVGAQVAQEELFFAAALAGGAVWAVFSWVGRARTEAWLLGFLFFAYVVGNRGFAQVTPVPGLPLFFAELGVAFAGSLWVLRGALERRSPWTATEISAFLVLWIALGAGRLWFDVRAWGLVALRDFATVYYAGFFFLALTLCRHDASRRVLQAALWATFVVLPITTLLADAFPRFFQTNLLVKGVPLILYKEDLATTFGYAGFIWLLPDRTTSARAALWRWPLAVLLLVTGLLGLSRASFAGLVVAGLWLLWSRRPRVLLTLGATALAGAALVLVLAFVPGRSFQQTRAYAVYEAVVSIADFSGTRVYRSGFSNDKGDNNRFRTVWWQTLAAETWREGPVLGLGFGADLARGFVNEYMPDTSNEFVTRSPHNVFMTVFGRMGLLGVLAWAAFYAAHALATSRVLRAARGREDRETEARLFAMSWIVLVSACFGVVLEGPMGAVPFWIMLGLAYATRLQSAAGSPDAEPATALAAETAKS
jgi:O-antigen ligase